ncbi:MAG: ABC transporter permease [Lachnospiraceae bacterium]|nr:ABC transporter permease [Lachnospiraceae bacterium]
MIIYENIRLALFSLKANKMRALLTMLGIIIGISSVIAIMTVGNSMTASVSDSMESMGANNITVGLQQKADEEESTEEGLQFGGPGRMKSAEDEDGFTYEMLENYCETYADSIQAISASENMGSGQILEGSLYANVSATGTSLGYFLANSVDILSGRFFQEREFDDGAMVALISDLAVDNMFEGDDEAAVGSQIQVNIGDKYYNFTVVGVYEYDQSSMGFSSSSAQDTTTAMYIPLKTAKELNHTENYLQFTVVTATGVDPEEFTETTENFFAAYYRNNRDFEPSAFSMSSMVEEMTSMLSTITLAISVIAGIALLVGGIGVMNIMLVSITERTREIGTRKALGAPNSSIRLQFIVESIVICLIGGIIGIILGVALGIGFAGFLGTSAKPSIDSIILSLTFSMAIGVFFGYYPANKAAKMDPIEALRYE